MILFNFLVVNGLLLRSSFFNGNSNCRSACLPRHSMITTSPRSVSRRADFFLVIFRGFATPHDAAGRHATIGGCWPVPCTLPVRPWLGSCVRVGACGGTGHRGAPAHGLYRRCEAIQLGARMSPASVMIHGCASPVSIASAAAVSAARNVEKRWPGAVWAGVRLDQRASSAGWLRSDSVMGALRSVGAGPVLRVMGVCSGL